jgi:hypothetical protein
LGEKSFQFIILRDIITLYMSQLPMKILPFHLSMASLAVPAGASVSLPPCETVANDIIYNVSKALHFSRDLLIQLVMSLLGIIEPQSDFLSLYRLLYMSLSCSIR